MCRRCLHSPGGSSIHDTSARFRGITHPAHGARQAAIMLQIVLDGSPALGERVPVMSRGVRVSLHAVGPVLVPVAQALRARILQLPNRVSMTCRT